MIGYAHRLHQLAGPLTLHYSAHTADDLAFADEITTPPLEATRAVLHISDSGQSGQTLMSDSCQITPKGSHADACGHAKPIMEAAMADATYGGFARIIAISNISPSPRPRRARTTVHRSIWLKSLQRISMFPQIAGSSEYADRAGVLPVDVKIAATVFCGSAPAGCLQGDRSTHAIMCCRRAQPQRRLITCQVRRATGGMAICSSTYKNLTAKAAVKTGRVLPNCAWQYPLPFLLRRHRNRTAG